MGAISAPEPLSDHHQLNPFNSGKALLDRWLKMRARRNEKGGALRTYVAAETDRVMAYYSLAAGTTHTAPVTVRRNMPDPIPVIVLERFAVVLQWQGRGLGCGLLKNAIFRAKSAADVIGARAVLVHALTEQAAAFYAHCGFMPSFL